MLFFLLDYSITIDTDSSGDIRFGIKNMFLC